MHLNLGGLLQQFLGGNQAPDAVDHFERVAQGTAPDVLSQGLTAMFNSDQTPAFGQMATQLTPAQVQTIAEHAEVHSPGIIEAMSRFYAQHPGLVKTLGSAALTIALAKIAERARA
jgi:hypothetical protein